MSVNVLVILAGVYTAHFMGLVIQGGRHVLALIGIASAAGLTLNVFLVHAAMEPIRTLEATARVRIRALAADVIRIGDQERADFARKFQDSTERALSTLIHQLQTAAQDSRDIKITERLETMHTMASNILRDIRSLVYTVHPNVLHELGLLTALESMAESINHWSEVAVEVRLGDGRPDDARSLPKDIATVLCRVTQEAVHNALKHANAHHITITLDITQASVVLRVADDGKGFDIGQVIRGHHGGSDLLTLRERVTLVGGTFEITSLHNHGTYLYASVPLRKHSRLLEG